MLRLAGAFITIKIKTIKIVKSFDLSRFFFFFNPAVRRYVLIYIKKPC